MAPKSDLCDLRVSTEAIKHLLGSRKSCLQHTEAFVTTSLWVTAVSPEHACCERQASWCPHGAKYAPVGSSMCFIGLTEQYLVRLIFASNH